MRETGFPVGKLPVDLLRRVLARVPVDDPRVLLGPGIGLDCAVIDYGDRLLVYKSDPVTFVSDALGDYLVRVNANDIATTGATPRWLLLTLLLPERRTTEAMVAGIMDQIGAACRELGVSLIGGHTEVTHGLDRPIAVGAMIGEVARECLVTPQGVRPGDRVLLTKGVPIEATAILAREFAERLRPALGEAALAEAADYLHVPGISVLRDARIAVEAGAVSAMHDPTEGGLAGALWELAEASGCVLRIDPGAVPVPALSRRVCAALGVDPMAAIASGALLITAAPAAAEAIRRALQRAGIDCADIGEAQAGAPAVHAGQALWRRPERDAIAELFSA